MFEPDRKNVTGLRVASFRLNKGQQFMKKQVPV
jgi:hypothetical protein